MPDNLVSVIIPVYNAENTIEKCLNSLVDQDVSLEIILVNDGSTDNSLAICRKYEIKYANIKVFTQTNSGVSVARNLGLDRASGKYIGFVDSDDYVHKSMFAEMKMMLKESDDNIIAICY